MAVRLERRQRLAARTVAEPKVLEDVNEAFGRLAERIKQLAG
jgi:hypothetical protein